MADGIKDGAAPKAVTTYKEEESRRAFESGNATFMRNWPYAYALGNDSKIKGKFDITTFPGYKGKPGAGVLGGYNLAISSYSKNPEGSLAFIEFATAPEQQKIMATEASLPPTVTPDYDDPAVKKAMPFAASCGTPSTRRSRARCRRSIRRSARRSTTTCTPRFRGTRRPMMRPAR